MVFIAAHFIPTGNFQNEIAIYLNPQQQQQQQQQDNDIQWSFLFLYST